MTWPEFVSLGTLLAVVIGAVVQWRKGKTDGYAAMTGALRTSGQTIGDLMTMLAELPEIKSKLSGALLRIDELENERAEWEIGVGLLIRQVVQSGAEPDWTPKGINRNMKIG